jgi:hypothetical protein
VVHLGEDASEQPVVRPHVRLVEHLNLTTAIALDPQEPRRERAEWLVQGLLTGWQGFVAVAAPVPP